MIKQRKAVLLVNNENQDVYKYKYIIMIFKLLIWVSVDVGQ